MGTRTEMLSVEIASSDVGLRENVGRLNGLGPNSLSSLLEEINDDDDDNEVSIHNVTLVNSHWSTHAMVNL